ncbi:hypothetical protein CLOM_g3232 [Closterium sp. NIES-68]|nr:hypothetical protein CLOM_g3232 [Closterium sp. NIES-68]GJP59650.1 hypothetical protein CLOP_g14229 [Closterium sp. NIES-67]GJP76379.1 hypothetical protein CLOP_g6834 [Closterium sp. NIES-67]
MAFDAGKLARRFLFSVFLVVLIFEAAYGADTVSTTDCSYCGTDVACIKQCTCEAPDMKPTLCIYSSTSSQFYGDSVTCKYACWPRILLFCLGGALVLTLIGVSIFLIVRCNRKRAAEQYAAKAGPAGAGYPPAGNV